MPRVGDSGVFAIEWEVTASEPPIDYGRFCFWVAGARVGGYTQEARVSEVATWLREFLTHAGERHLDFLDGKSTKEVFSYIRDTATISQNPGESLEDATKRHDREIPHHLHDDWRLHGWLRTVFHLDNVGGDAFYDHVDMILMNDHALQMQRLIWRDVRSMRLFEARLPDRLFDDVAEQFLAEYSPPTLLTFQFRMSHGEPIQQDGVLAHTKYQRQVRGWERIRFTLIPGASPAFQGVRIKSGKVEMECDDWCQRDLILWAEHVPKQFDIKIIGQQGAVLKIWNVWRSASTSAHIEGLVGDAGIRIDEKPNGVKLFCSDGVGEPDFQDLIVELDLLGATPG